MKRIIGFYYLRAGKVGGWMIEWVQQMRSWHLSYDSKGLDDFQAVNKFPTAEDARAFVASGNTGFQLWDGLHPESRDVALSRWERAEKEIDETRDAQPE